MKLKVFQKMPAIFAALALVLAGLAFTSCDGPVGPQGYQGYQGYRGYAGAAGPAGSTGPTGPAGPAGADGADGADGSPGIQGPPGPVIPAGEIAISIYPAAPNLVQTAPGEYTLLLFEGYYIDLIADVYPDNALVQTLIWSASGDGASIARVERPARLIFTGPDTAVRVTASDTAGQTATLIASAIGSGGNEVTATVNVTVAALFTITFDANTGSGAPGAMTGLSPFDAHTLPEGRPTRPHYLFMGWGLTSDATLPAAYQPGGSFSGTYDVTLYAIWARLTTIRFNANNGTGTQEDMTDVGIAGYSSGLLPDQGTMERANYLFMGWDIYSDTVANALIPAARQVGSSFTVTGQDVTLYAIWAPLRNITFSGGNYATGTPPEARQNVGIDGEVVQVTLPASFGDLRRNGHSTFAWSTVAAPASASEVHEKGTTVTITLDGDRTLYVTWVSLVFGPPYETSPENALIGIEQTPGMGEIDLHLVPSSVDHSGNPVTHIRLSGNRDFVSIEIPASVTCIQQAFESGFGLNRVVSRVRTVTFAPGSQLTTIGWNAFRSCEYLENIEIPASVTRIESHAFDFAHRIARLEIPPTVTYVGSDAFAEWGLGRELVGGLPMGDLIPQRIDIHHNTLTPSGWNARWRALPNNAEIWNVAGAVPVQLHPAP